MNSEFLLRNENEPRGVVALGAPASEDGLECLKIFLSGVSADTGHAYVVVQHLAGVNAPKVQEALAQCTSMPTLQADAGTVFSPNCIYVLDLSADVALDSDGRITAAQADACRSFDDVFGRLAHAFGSRSIAVLLGANDEDEEGDGVQGLTDIQNAGGLTLVRAAEREQHHGLKPAIDEGVVDVVMDVEYMPRALERFAEQQSYAEGRSLLAAIVSSSDDAIVSKTLDGIVLSWNDAAQRIFGYTAEEMIGRSIETIIPSDRLGEERDILAKLRRGERIEHFETVRVAKDGRRLDISLTISPIRDKSGRVVAASKVARDITARKLAEAALEEANRRKDEYLAMLGHELRNPLAAIQSAGEVIENGGDCPELIEHASAILERQSSHMARLLDGLLDVSRITRGKLHVEMKPVDLTNILNDVGSGSTSKAEIKGVALLAKYDNEPLELCGDATRLTQIFANLIDNALKFTDEGGRVWIDVHVDGETVEVEVGDTGQGFAAEEAERIFEAFRQGPQDFSRSKGGLGLGLALARGLVEQHGGTIHAQSEGENRGALFTVRLPRTKAASSAGRSSRTTPSR